MSQMTPRRQGIPVSAVWFGLTRVQAAAAPGRASATCLCGTALATVMGRWQCAHCGRAFCRECGGAVARMGGCDMCTVCGAGSCG